MGRKIYFRFLEDLVRKAGCPTRHVYRVSPSDGRGKRAVDRTLRENAPSHRGMLPRWLDSPTHGRRISLQREEVHPCTRITPLELDLVDRCSRSTSQCLERDSHCYSVTRWTSWKERDSSRPNQDQNQPKPVLFRPLEPVPLSIRQTRILFS